MPFTKQITFKILRIYKKRFQGTGNLNKNLVKPHTMVTDDDFETVNGIVSQDRLSRAGMSESELKIMLVMAGGKQIHQSLVGLLKEPALKNEQVNETLSSLMAKGLVKQKLNEENKLRLYLTPKGEQLLGKYNMVTNTGSDNPIVA